MAKEYKYRCLHCNHLFYGCDECACPNCGSEKLEKLLFYKLIEIFTGEKKEKKIK